jgi:hypothetical protein
VYFGATSFASAAFSDVGFNPNAFVNVLGSQINTSTGTVATIGKALVLPTGIQNNFTVGNIVIRINQTASPTGEAFSLSTGTVSVIGDANFAVTGNQFNFATGTVVINLTLQQALLM